MEAQRGGMGGRRGEAFAHECFAPTRTALRTSSTLAAGGGVNGLRTDKRMSCPPRSPVGGAASAPWPSCAPTGTRQPCSGAVSASTRSPLAPGVSAVPRTRRQPSSQAGRGGVPPSRAGKGARGLGPQRPFGRVRNVPLGWEGLPGQGVRSAGSASPKWLGTIVLFWHPVTLPAPWHAVCIPLQSSVNGGRGCGAPTCRYGSDVAPAGEPSE